MARIFTEDFESGSDGTTITSANSGFNYAAGSPRFATAAAQTGTLGMECSPSGYGQAPFGARTTAYLRAYVRYMSLGTIGWHWNLLSTTPAVVATLRVNANGTLRVMPGTSGTILETAGDGRLTAGEWARLEWAITGTTMQLRMFVGANIHGTTPTFESAATTWTGATIQASQIGDVSGSGLGVHVDQLAVDDSTWVGPEVAPEPPPPAFHQAWDGAAWRNLVRTP